MGFFLADFVPGSPEDQFLKQLAKEEQQRQKRREENAVADDILSKLRNVSDSLTMSSIGSKTGDKSDLSAIFDSMKLDERWTFQQGDDAAWIGYKLNQVSEADRKRLAEKAAFANIFKSPSNSKGNEYDGGDVVYLYHYIPKTFKW